MKHRRHEGKINRPHKQMNKRKKRSKRKERNMGGKISKRRRRRTNGTYTNDNHTANMRKNKSE